MRDSRIGGRGAGAPARMATVWALAAFSLLSCGDDDGDASSAGSSGPKPDGGTQADTGLTDDGDRVSERDLAACPLATTLIDSTEWSTCLAGKRLVGTEPFNGTACELHIGNNGAFVYVRNGAPALSVPERSAWRSGTGSYMNDARGQPRIFLAGIAPSLTPIEGQPRVTNVDISIFGLAGQTDTVKVSYLDAALARETYTCMLDGF